MSARLEQLADALAPLIAERVVERVLSELGDKLGPSVPELITANEVARRFNVSRNFVYRNGARLGAIPLGSGPKARIRFNPQRVAEALDDLAREPEPQRTPPKRRRPTTSNVELLPIKGEERP